MSYRRRGWSRRRGGRVFRGNRGGRGLMRLGYRL